jgi:DNA gyrase subunit A
VYSLNAFQIPQASRTARGLPAIQLLPIPKEEKITAMLAVSEFTEDEYLVMLTQNGYIKKTALSAFAKIRSNGLIAISLEDGDELRWVRLARQEDSIIVASSEGMAIHFQADHSQLRPLGRSTRGVRSMKLKSDDDKLVSMDIVSAQITAAIASADNAEEDDDNEEVSESVDQGPWVIAVTTKGFGKRVPVGRFRLQNRAGMGLRAIKFKSKDDRLASLRIVNPEDELMLVTGRGIMIRQAVESISLQSRSATGVRVQRLDGDDAIVAVALVPPPAEGEDPETAAEDTAEE